MPREMGLGMPVKQQHGFPLPGPHPVYGDTFVDDQVERRELRHEYGHDDSFPDRARFIVATSNAPSHLATMIVATPLPMRFVSARASDMKRSTPNTKDSPASGK